MHKHRNGDAQGDVALPALCLDLHVAITLLNLCVQNYEAYEVNLSQE